MKIQRLRIILSFILLLSLQTSCVSRAPLTLASQQEERIYSKTFYTDYGSAWQSGLEALSRFEKVVQNRQSGIIQTTWIDSTAQQNFIDPYGADSPSLRSKYRLRVSFSQGKQNGKDFVKVSILKDQLIQNDILEGWKKIQSEPLEENGLLYRIGRLIWMKTQIKEIERQRIEETINSGV